MADPKINLPEGVEFVGIGLITGDTEFEYFGDGIRRGKRAGAAAQVIVKPAAGYTFQPQRFWDIRDFKYLEVPGMFVPVKSFDEPLHSQVTLKFAITNETERQIVDEALEKVKGLPGYVETIIG